MASARAGSGGHELRGKVLIVDDQESMRELLRMILEGDYHISEADSGAALHKALNHEQPDVVLLDMHLPDANGVHLLPVIANRWPQTQVIILTGAPSDSEAMSSVVEAVNRGACTLLHKTGDFDFGMVLAGVNNALDRRYQAQERPTLRLEPGT
jgi:DNA-binding NtrC family response regulator